MNNLFIHTQTYNKVAHKEFAVLNFISNTFKEITNIPEYNITILHITADSNLNIDIEYNITILHITAFELEYRYRLF